MTLFVMYIVAQVSTTLYGVHLIKTIRKDKKYRQKLKDSGYKMNRNSLYTFNDEIKLFFKGFIPGFYMYKAYQLVTAKDPAQVQLEEDIKEGRYVPEEEYEAELKKQEKAAEESIFYNLNPNVTFYADQPYKAKKNTVDYLDTYEEESKFNVVKADKDFEISPYVDTKVPDPIIIPDATKEDIARAITELDTQELKALNKNINNLIDIKEENKILSLEKDAA